MMRLSCEWHPNAHSPAVSHADWTARRPKPFALRVERLQWRKHRLVVAAALLSIPFHLGLGHADRLNAQSSESTGDEARGLE